MLWSPPDESPKSILSFEVLNALACFYSLEHRTSNIKGTVTRADLLTDIVAQKALFEAVIIRLCRLDSDDKTDWSLREVLKLQQLTEANKKLAHQQLTTFRTLINPYKVEYRNKRIAHLSKLASNLEREIPNLSVCLRRLIEVTDTIMGAEQTYTLRLGSFENLVDLRKVVETRTI